MPADRLATAISCIVLYVKKVWARIGGVSRQGQQYQDSTDSVAPADTCLEVRHCRHSDTISRALPRPSFSEHCRRCVSQVRQQVSQYFCTYLCALVCMQRQEWQRVLVGAAPTFPPRLELFFTE